MDDISISEIKKKLINYYINTKSNDNLFTKNASWIYAYRSVSGLTNITVVSDRFEGLSHQDRRLQVQQLVNCPTGSLSLYTIQEAEVLELDYPDEIQNNSVRTWHDLVAWSQNHESTENLPIVNHPKVVAFYSFKGGVGRTTALTHVAWLLAKNGKKVVVVDLDLEAPGLNTAFNLRDIPQLGLVDYLYERAYALENSNFQISIGDIFTEVHVDETSGQLIVVSAGQLGFSYFAKVDDLKSTSRVDGIGSLWDVFKQDIIKQVRPDIILVDSRTGINQWSAFSLIQNCDEIFIFLFPNLQNLQGVSTLVELLAKYSQKEINFVFSPVPDLNQDTLFKVDQLHDQLNRIFLKYKDLSDGLNESDRFSIETQDLSDQRIVIPYLPAIARAESYPVVPLATYYQEIANYITRNGFDKPDLKVSANRWSILKSLNFPRSFDAGRNQSNLERIFQRTTQFNRLLEETTCLILGKKGTGKTAIYRFLTDQYCQTTISEKFRDGQLLSRLQDIYIVSGYGQIHGIERPSKDYLSHINQAIQSLNSSWSSFWRLYTLIRIYQQLSQKRQEKSLLKLSRHSDLRALKESLNIFLKPQFGNKQLESFIQILSNPAQCNRIPDVFRIIHENLSKESKSLWILYDDLDEDFSARGSLQKLALQGLFEFLQELDARNMIRLQLKIFLREDIWKSLVFENKSHLNGRYVVIEWKHIDFLRLAYRFITQSPEIHEYLNEVRIIPEQEIDNVNETQLSEALRPFWGDRIRKGSRGKQVYRWMYERLMDTSGTAFPRSLPILLDAASKKELEYEGEAANRTPKQQLLRTDSLVAGLKKASEERCDAIRTEIQAQYPELEKFFDQLQNFSALLTNDELKSTWELLNSQDITDDQASLTDYESFKKLLIELGLIEYRPKDDKYRFADIYAYGFGMKRTGVP